jgi:imidazole glycerol-phosphate synthase
MCIGIQVLFASSTEPPSVDGLGIESPIGLFDNAGPPMPHMDWNLVALLTSGKENRARERIETGMDEDGTYYFVYSFP